MMNRETFWSLIETARQQSGGDRDRQIEVLTKQLRLVTPEDLIDFDQIFGQLHAEAYVNELWAAAYIINGGCSDDGFVYFRSWLIGQGQRVYEEALRDPNTLADALPPNPDDEAELEELAYVARQVYEEVVESEMPDRTFLHPRLKGAKWDEDTVDDLFPLLAQKADARLNS